MTSRLLREVHRQIYQLNNAAFRDDETSFHERKGQIKGLTWLLEHMDVIEAEILGKDQQHEEEDDE